MSTPPPSATQPSGAAAAPGPASESTPGIDARLEEQAIAHAAQMQALVQQQAVYARGISHDLRAPLRAIEGFAGLLAAHAEPVLDATGRDYVARIRHAASRMGGLVDSLAELSRVDAATLADGPVDMSLLADWALAERADAEPQRPTTFRVQPGLQARGDERLLRLLMHHLIHNAWKFTPAHAGVDIEVTGDSSGGHTRLSIRDCGLGFDMRYVDKLFQPFQRLHGPEQGGGHGLGLAIADRVAARHRGRIWADSAPGAGSTFHVELPNTQAVTP